MILYAPSTPETAAATALLRTHFPDAAGDIERGAGILPQLQYSPAADAEQRQANQKQQETENGRTDRQQNPAIAGGS